MTEPLDKLVDRLADELFRQMEAKWAEGEYWKAQIENALCKAIRAALAEPTEAMKEKMLRLALRTTVTDWNKYAGELWNEGAAERLKELG